MAQEATRRVLEVDYKQKGIFFVEVSGVDVGVQSERVAEHLPESFCVHLLGAITMLELIFAFWVFTLKKFFEVLKTNQSLGHVAVERAELQDRSGVRFSLCTLSRGFFWHFKSVVDARQLDSF